MSRAPLVATAALTALLAMPGAAAVRAAGPAVHDRAAVRQAIPVRDATVRLDRESYAPGAIATLTVAGVEPPLALEVVDAATRARVTRPRAVGSRVAGVRIGRWSPGVYVARLTRGEVIAQAPLVVRAPANARPRVAVVLPTSTWQAYNLTDADGDGAGDTWYATRRRESARLDRPYAGDGLPRFFHRYDRPFLRWLRARGREADFLGDGDLDRIRDAAALARRYDLLVFPGHHEYVTQHEFDLIEGYRDLGGNLVFLSADNLHWRVVRDGPVLRRKEQWRRRKHELPEAALVGVQYRASDDGTRRGAYVVRNTRCAPWVFAGTGLAQGSRFGWGGVEIDAVTRDSPAGICVLAEIPDLLGPGRTAQMSFYETGRGACVFAAGAFSLPNRSRVTWKILDNLWERLSRP